MYLYLLVHLTGTWALVTTLYIPNLSRVSIFRVYWLYLHLTGTWILVTTVHYVSLTYRESQSVEVIGIGDFMISLMRYMNPMLLNTSKYDHLISSCRGFSMIPCVRLTWRDVCHMSTQSHTIVFSRHCVSTL